MLKHILIFAKNIYRNLSTYCVLLYHADAMTEMILIHPMCVAICKFYMNEVMIRLTNQYFKKKKAVVTLSHRCECEVNTV